MRHVIYIIILLPLVTSCLDKDRLTTLESLETDVDTETIHFEHKKFATAITAAKESKKLIFIYVGSPYCRRCKQMELDVFPDTVVSNFINENFISSKFYLKKTTPPLSSKSSEYKKLNKSLLDFMDEYNCYIAFPTFVIIDSNGELMKKKTGSMNAQELVDFGENSIAKMRE